MAIPHPNERLFRDFLKKDFLLEHHLGKKFGTGEVILIPPSSPPTSSPVGFAHLPTSQLGISFHCLPF